MVFTVYKDDMQVVIRTVASLAEQTDSARIVLLLTWEENTPDREQRTKQLQEKFACIFQSMLFSVHPHQLPHDIASKCSNANWSVKQLGHPTMCSPCGLLHAHTRLCVHVRVAGACATPCATCFSA